ncbi:MAG: hypothetical protein ACRENH_00805 [Gemmatimonadaceae bacterium]
MSEDAAIRVYINGRGVDAPAGSRALDAVRVWDAQIAAEIEGGRRALADSRGLPLDPATLVFSGLIMRIVSNRAERNAAST